MELYVFGKDVCYYVWEEHYPSVANLILNGNGSLIELNNKMGNKDTILNDMYNEFKVGTQINKEQHKLIKAHIKLILKNKFAH